MKTLATLMMGPLLALASGQVTQAMIDEAAGNVATITVPVKNVIAPLMHQTLDVELVHQTGVS